jgi:hypothetical protein
MGKGHGVSPEEVDITKPMLGKKGQAVNHSLRKAGKRVGKAYEIIVL